MLLLVVADANDRELISLIQLARFERERDSPGLWKAPEAKQKDVDAWLVDA